MTRPRGIVALAFLLVWSPQTRAQDKDLAYPETRRENIVGQIFGEAVEDPYRWLEDGESAEVTAWADAQNKVGRQYLDNLPNRDKIAARLNEVLDIAWTGTPWLRSGRYFYYGKQAGWEKPVLFWRDGEDGEERVLIDPNALSTKGRNIALGRWSVSRDGKKIAFALKENNADEAVVQVMEIESGEISEIDRLTEIRHSRFAWAPDGSGFYYTYLPKIPGVPETERPGRAEVRFHRLGTVQSDDELIFGPTGDPRTFLRPRVSWDGRWLLVYVWRGWSGVEVHLMDLQADSSTFQTFFKSDAVQIWIEPHEDYFYISSNEGASNKQVFRVKAGTLDRAAWELIVPEREQAVLDEIHISKGKLLLRYTENAHHQIQIHELDGRLINKVETPEPGVTRWIKTHPEEDAAFYTFSSFTRPWQSFRISMDNQKSRLWADVEIPIDVSNYTTKQIWYRSKDGTRVPMFVVGRKDLPLDGSTPFLLYGYGGYGINVRPTFIPALFAWLEAGGAYASPNIRGGGEFGVAWHRAGMLRNKQNVFDDFIAAAETLVERGYTKPDRLAIRGNSNGGLLVGAAMTQRPDLFGAVLCGVPLLDMVRFTHLSVGKTWIEEFGSPEVEGDFRVLHGYSPYHRVARDVAYPPILIRTADTDDRVDPAHARKMAAALQATHVTPGNPVILKVDRQAGHGGSGKVSADVARWTDNYAFLMHIFGMTPGKAPNP